MKTKILISLISLFAICSCTKKSESKFLFLSAAQLKPLGIELNEKGIFYKNENPNWKQDKEKYPGLAFYCTKENYISSIAFTQTDTLKVTNASDSIIASKELTQNDFYPLLVGNINGIQSMDTNIPSDMKLLPIAICMAEANLSSRKDTVVVWLKPTESLRKALPQEIDINDYLRSKPVKKQR